MAKVSEQVLTKLRNDPRIRRLYDLQAGRPPCRRRPHEWIAELQDGKVVFVEDIPKLGGLTGSQGAARKRLGEVVFPPQLNLQRLTALPNPPAWRFGPNIGQCVSHNLLKLDERRSFFFEPRKSQA
jgi:hypothetical protein